MQMTSRADYLTKTAATVNDAQTDILKGDIPVPVWEVNGGNAAVVDYWKNASKTDDGKADGSNTVYTQKDEILMTSYTKGVESKVMVGDVDNVYSADFTRHMLMASCPSTPAMRITGQTATH